jgi:hypothetical protein
MARKSDPLSDSFGTDESEGWLGGLVADEDDLDRHTLWRLGLWGVAAVGALTLGILSGQLPVNAQRVQIAANDFAGHAKQVETSVHENQLEARRLSAAIETLNSDRDRLFSRLSALEQGLDVVTGSINKKTDDKHTVALWPDAATAPIINAAPFAIAVPPATPAPTITIAAYTPVEPERTPPPQPVRATDPSPVENSAPEPTPVTAPASVIQSAPLADPQPVPQETAVEEIPVAVADFGVDLGAANSINGLRALWRGLIKSHKTQFDGLRPLLAVHERRNGLGLQLRLIAGPIKDAAAAARICAVLSDEHRDCKTTAFDGQRLSLAAEPEAAPIRPAKKPRKPVQAEQSDADKARMAAERSSSVATILGVR